jgi:hypothetical protein
MFNLVRKLFITYYRYACIMPIYLLKHKTYGSQYFILQIYAALGFVEIMDWSVFPTTTNNYNPNADIFNADTFTAINDCLYRMRSLARFAVFMDLDEILMVQQNSPIKSLNITEFLNGLSEQYPNAGALM